MPEGEEERLEIKNLLEKLMKENFPNLAKENHTSPESTKSPKQYGHKKNYTSHIVIKNAKG